MLAVVYCNGVKYPSKKKTNIADSTWSVFNKNKNFGYGYCKEWVVNMLSQS